MPADIETIIKDFSNAAARHPKLNPEIVDIMVDLPPLLKRRREDYVKVRKEFDDLFIPFKAGKTFESRSVFRGLSYDKLPEPVAKLEAELKLTIVKRVQKEASDEQLRKDIAEHERLLKQEEEWRKKMNQLTSDEVRRDLMIEEARVWNDRKSLEIQLKMAQLPEDSSEYQRLLNEIVLYGRGEHPDQLPVKKKVEDFFALKDHYLQEDHERAVKAEERRKRLGLPR